MVIWCRFSFLRFLQLEPSNQLVPERRRNTSQKKDAPFSVLSITVEISEALTVRIHRLQRSIRNDPLARRCTLPGSCFRGRGLILGVCRDPSLRDTSHLGQLGNT